jgi:Domain of unknown function (DU1801)
MHQQPPKTPLLRSTNAANASQVDSPRASTVYVGPIMKPSVTRCGLFAGIGSADAGGDERPRGDDEAIRRGAERLYPTVVPRPPIPTSALSSSRLILLWSRSGSWRGVPVWYHDGTICTGETYKSVVNVTFAKAASLGDPSGLFNSSLEGNTRRAIDFHEGDEIDEDAFKTLIRALQP